MEKTAEKILQFRRREKKKNTF